MAAETSFLNPLHQGVLGDPFVLKFNGSYYAYGTPASGAIPVLRSQDLVTWKSAGDAVAPPPAGQQHWAPEVAYRNGCFYLYYSTGAPEGEGHQLRVAVATSPTGPFEEQPDLLDPADPFSIDAHPFLDDDGQWYLFYSRDFLEGERVGTGIVVDQLVDMTSLGGDRRTVLRPHAEWQIYQRDRHWYDRVWDWFTVEGPFVRKHDGRYWCFYSGGAWRADTYGVSAAVADHPLGPYEPMAAHEGAALLRTAPGTVLGPGHACVALAPDNVSEYLVYHAWDPSLSGRRMFADPLLWVDGRPTTPGPRVEPQPYPPAPALRDLFGDGRGRPLDPRHWYPMGSWELGEGEALHAGNAVGTAIATVTVPPSYTLEVNLALRQAPSVSDSYGVLTAYGDDDNHDAVLIHPANRQVTWRSRRGGVDQDAVLVQLREAFCAEAYHQLLIRRSSGQLDVKLDGVALQPATDVLGRGAVGLWTNASTAFAGVALTDLHAATDAPVLTDPGPSHLGSGRGTD